MAGLRIIEELDEYKMSREKMILLKKEVGADMLKRMEQLELENRTPVLVIDTYIDTVAESYTRADGKPLNRKDALDIIRNALELNSEIMKSDGVVISFRHKMLTCSMGHRYSDALRACPDKMHGGRA
jgi:hypothetical protein